MAIVLWLILISIAVIFHELAHYFAARWQGVKVKAFSVGMGPILWKRQWEGTEWRISALPLGGYVDIDGLSATADANGKLVAPTTGMAKLPYVGKVAILAAGPLINIILAVILLAGVYWSRGAPTNQVMIKEITQKSQAAEVGLLPNDVILAIDDRKITKVEQISDNLKTDGQRNFTIERDGQVIKKAFDWSPSIKENGERPKFGVKTGQKTRSVGAFQSISQATSDLFIGVPEAVGSFFKAIGNAFTFQNQQEGVVGVSGMIGAVADSAQAGFFGLLLFFVILNFSLGILNLLPIPALDGGRILIATIVAIRGKPLAPGREEMINFLGFAFLIVFMLLINFREIVGI